MTRKWSPKVCRGTIVEVCSLEMDSPCLLLESSRVRERNVISRIGWSYLAASQEEMRKEKREGAWLALTFYDARGGVPGQNGMGRSYRIKCMISIFQWLNNSRTK